MAIAGETELSELAARPEAFLRVPVGVMSPLWVLFAGAAVTGATWWWMTRWARPTNLEALFGATEGAGAPLEGVVEVAAPTLNVAAETVEAAAEPVIEAVAETSESVLEALAKPAEEVALAAATEAALPPEPVGGESAPISPVLEAVERIEAEVPKPAVEHNEAEADRKPAVERRKAEADRKPAAERRKAEADRKPTAEPEPAASPPKPKKSPTPKKA
jgi:hypothetical protein